MKFGERYETELVSRITKKSFKATHIHKRTEWNGWHTNNEGEGLWNGDRQILGTSQFSVAGCTTEKAAKAKVREYAKRYYN
jgi:hypothetical protein